MVASGPIPADRGQLLIIGAIGMVIFLIGLALALNTAAYGEVYTPQSDVISTEEREIVRLADAVDRMVVGVTPSGPIADADFDEVTEAIEQEIDVWTETTSLATAGDGIALDVEVVEVKFASHLVQNESAVLSDHTGTKTAWTVADSVDRIHHYEMELNNDDLVATEDCASGQCFGISVTGDNDETWQLNASRMNASEDIVIEVQLGNGSKETQTVNDSAVELNLTAGDIVSQNETYSFTPVSQDPEIVGPYTVEYVNPTNASGTYELSTSGTVVTDTIDEDERYDRNASPRVDPEVTSVTVAIDVQTPTISQQVRHQIEVGEIND